MVALIALLALSQDRPSNEWEPVLEAPKNLTHVLTIAAPAHAGPRMELRGRVLRSDGRTPVPGAIVYFHHTDGRGIYPRPAGSRPTEWIYWHGSVRGWLKSAPDGRYVLRTTKPAPYPNRREAAHIHVYVLVPGARRGATIPGIVFKGDPFLTPQDKGIVELKADKKGVLQGRFDLVVPR